MSRFGLCAEDSLWFRVQNNQHIPDYCSHFQTKSNRAPNEPVARGKAQCKAPSIHVGPIVPSAINESTPNHFNRYKLDDSITGESQEPQICYYAMPFSGLKSIWRCGCDEVSPNVSNRLLFSSIRELVF